MLAVYFLLVSPPVQFLYQIDYIIYVSSFLSHISIFFISTMMHTFNCHSENVNKCFTKLDYFGITSGTNMLFIVGWYFMFYDNLNYRRIYTLITFFLATLVLYVAFQVNQF